MFHIFCEVMESVLIQEHSPAEVSAVHRYREIVRVLILMLVKKVSYGRL